MSKITLSRRAFLASAAASTLLPFSTRAMAAEAIRVISHRQPALEYYTDKMKAALPAGRVTTELMPIDKEVELASITMSAGSDAVDVAYLNDTTLKRFAANGWLEPLDDLWAKYKDEFKLDDFPDSVVQSVSYKGHIYSMPILTNTEMFFYRTDLFEENGVTPPKTMQDYLADAKAFTKGRTAGTIMTMKPVDGALNETHWYMNAVGKGWFDDQYKPIFNEQPGVDAVSLMKEMSQYAARGFASAANDESTINLQQGLAAMGLQWFTRAAAMDDPKKSRVVGKIDWVAPPSGGHRIANDGYAISKFSSKDKDEIFRMLATAANQESMRGGAELAMPPRRSVLSDPELNKKYRWYPAASASLEVGKAFPDLPEFLDVGEIVTRYVLQAVTGELEVKPALDKAAQETTDLLKSRGYYKSA
ncbi:MAG TPA: extracellular solute-binding protein [Limnochordia bacterium]|nr:extracellular solute-binding protein [Limnochordia bacterium]